MESTKQYLEKLIGNKRIVLWGTGNTGNNFYTKYKNVLPIYACTSNDKEIKPIQQLKAIPYTEVNKEKDFVIICSIYYEEIRNQLLLNGGGIEFINSVVFEQLYESALYEKQLIVAIGQCEIWEMCEILNRVKSFREKYWVIYFNEWEVCSHGNMFDVAKVKDCLNILKIADYFIKPSSISPQAMKGFSDLQKKLGEECSVVTVSLFHFDSYWPQDIAKERSINKYYMAERNKKLAAYIEREQVIEKFVDEGLSVSQIMKKIANKDFFRSEEVIENHKRTIKRAQISDRISGIKISDFIESQYSKIKLFCDRGHFNKYLLREYVKRILIFFKDYEGIKEVENLCIDDMFTELNELPIYPSTASILELEWVKEDTLYRQKRYDGVRLLTFEEYMESLIQYCYLIKDTKKLCYFFVSES